MSSWKKRLAAMLNDGRPNSYTYDDATSILENLGFKVAGKPSGSHRRWRIVLDDKDAPTGKRTVVIGLVDSGRGPMKSVYIKEMLAVLRENKLLPEGVD